MTTIIYKDGVLAADTRRTSTAKNALTKCNNCGVPGDHAVDTVSKLHASRLAVFRGEVVRVFGGSGKVTMLNWARDLLLKGEDIESIYTGSFKLHGKRFDDSFSLIILTDVANYIFRIRDGAPSVTKYAKTTTIAIGSGQGAALLCAKAFDFDALGSLQGAAFQDDATGGFTQWVHEDNIAFDNNQLVVNQVVPTGEDTAHAAFLTAVMGSEPLSALRERLSKVKPLSRLSVQTHPAAPRSTVPRFKLKQVIG